MTRRKKRIGGSHRKPKAKRGFRSKVDIELVDQLLYRFVGLVKHGLGVMLCDPSELTQKEFRRNPEMAHSNEDIPKLVLWTAVSAYELPWEGFCQHVLTHPVWTQLLGVQTQADLDQLKVDFDNYAIRLIELAVHDGLKEGDKKERRPAEQRPEIQHEFAAFIAASQVLKLLKKRLRPFLKRLDKQDPKRPRHRPRTYRTRSFVLADLLRWMLGLSSTNDLIRKLQRNPSLAGAVNFKPGEIPSKSTFSRRRMAVGLDDLKAILHELVEVLTHCGVMDGRAWVVDLTRLPTYSSVSKSYPERPNGKSDPQAAFCGYPDNDGGLQFGYCLLWIVDFKTELPIALLFAAGNAQDSPLTVPLLKEACEAHPSLAHRCQYFIADGGYDTLDIFNFILQRLRALPTITKNPRNASDPTADLATDELCVLRRRSPLYMALFHSRTSVERTNSWAKLTFNLKNQKQRGWNAIEHCVLYAAIAMLSVAWVAVKTGHPDKIRSARTWISCH